jgi:hypothetical protein
LTALFAQAPASLSPEERHRVLVEWNRTETELPLQRYLHHSSGGDAQALAVAC